MNIKNYREKKIKNLIKIIPAGGGHAFSIKNFDPETGDELEPIIESIDLDILIKEKTEHQMNVIEYIELISDIKKIIKNTTNNYINKNHGVI
jgi:hypothetical protein